MDEFLVERIQFAVKKQFFPQMISVRKKRQIPLAGKYAQIKSFLNPQMNADEHR